MATTPLPRLSFVGKDFVEIRQQLIAAIPTITPAWSDFNESDVGIALLELMASVGAMLSFYLDHQANEAFLPTARERKNVINLCKLIAYQLENVVSSTTLLQFTAEAPVASRVDIPKFTRVGTSQDDVVLFATTAVATIPAGDTTVLVGARQGVLVSEKFSTTGLPNQSFQLLNTLIDVGSIELVIDDVVWQAASSFVSAEASDRFFVVDVDAASVVRVNLGDGFFGYSPPLSAASNVLITYLLSVGSAGNVGTGVVRTLLDPILDINGNTVSLSVTNIQAATGGADQETIEHARTQAPAELAALFRAVTIPDYVALCSGFAGIGKANAWGEQESNPPNYNLFNWVNVVASPAGLTRAALLADPVNNGLLSDQLKSDLRQFLLSRKDITVRVKIVNPVYVPIDVAATVYYEAGALATQVKAAAIDALVAFFDPASVSFGQAVYLSNVSRIIDIIPGVDHSQVTQLATDPPEHRGVEGVPDDVASVISLTRYSLPYLRNLTITVQPSVFLPTPSNVYPCPPNPPAPHD